MFTAHFKCEKTKSDWKYIEDGTKMILKVDLNEPFTYANGT